LFLDSSPATPLQNGEGSNSEKFSVYAPPLFKEREQGVRGILLLKSPKQKITT